MPISVSDQGVEAMPVERGGEAVANSSRSRDDPRTRAALRVEQRWHKVGVEHVPEGFDKIEELGTSVCLSSAGTSRPFFEGKLAQD